MEARPLSGGTYPEPRPATSAHGQRRPSTRWTPPWQYSNTFNRSLGKILKVILTRQKVGRFDSNVVADVDHILTAPETQDEGVWKYEHLRQFCMELNGLAVKLQGDCKPDTCSQMTATEQWIFLCAAHKTPKECPAIDYTRHTLDGAACLLNSNKYFPSRVSIKESSVAKLGSVCRRVYRIFSHAYFHHRFRTFSLSVLSSILTTSYFQTNF